MKVVGIMCVKDEADLLPEVLEHLNGKLDALYAYDDGSIDETYKILKSWPGVTYLMRKQDDINRMKIKRPHYHHLLEKIKEDFAGEEVWVVITMGDRFFLNKTPRQIAEDAEAKGYTTVNGVQLDFLRHRQDPWTEENDTFPRYEKSLRQICTWFKFDERCILAFKLSDERSYLKSRYPWPRGGNDKVQYKVSTMDAPFSTDIPYVEHQGRRSPNAMLWRLTTGSRKLSHKVRLNGFDFDNVRKAWDRFYLPYRVFPWKDVSSLEEFVEVNNRWPMPKDEWDQIFLDIEKQYTHNTREDL